ncbi:MAG: alpha/beta hydrolase [Candidatus Coatesbacteria bacterium]|nr:alpha/beta hydrolase [Candidatus Coatesbacteria bacterium]
MTEPVRDSKRKPITGTLLIAGVAIAAVIIAVVIIVYSIDWEAYLDEKIAEAMMSDIGAPTRSPKDIGLDFAGAAIKTEDGIQLSGWFIPSGQSKITAVFCRGAEGNIGTWLDMMRHIHDLDCNILTFDYRGTGLSGGNPSFIGIEKDIAAAVQHAKDNYGKAASRIIIFGVSVGAAVGINVAATSESVDAIISDSPFTSFSEMIPRVIMDYAPELANKMPKDEILTDQHDPIKHVADISPSPILILANENDQLCPAEMSQSLYRAGRAPKDLWIAPGTGHVEAKDAYPTEYWGKVGEFINYWLIGARAPKFDVSSKVKETDDGKYEIRLRVSNTGGPVAEDIPVAVFIETETGDLQENIFFPKTRMFMLTTDSKPIGFRAMRFFSIEPDGDSWKVKKG